MPEPIPVRPRLQPGAADVASLVHLGREEPPPIPAPVFLEPAYPDGTWTDGTDEPT